MDCGVFSPVAESLLKPRLAEIRRHFVPETSESFVNLPRPVEGSRNMRQNILLSDVTEGSSGIISSGRTAGMAKGGKP